MTSTIYKYESNNKRTNIASFFFGLFSIFSFLTLIMDGYVTYLLNNSIQLQTPEAYKLFSTYAGYVDILNSCVAALYVGSAIVFLAWIYRANNNAHALNKETNFEFTPGWSVGSFFVPLFNLYWPYKVMREIWRVSQKNNGVAIVIIWWLTFWFCNITANIGAKWKLDTVHDVKMYLLIDAISNLFGIIASVSAIVIMRKIQAREI